MTLTHQAPVLRTRDVPPRAAHTLAQAGVHPILARVLAARGVRSIDELSDDMARLLPPTSLLHAQAAGVRLARAIIEQEHVLVVADYDCDGATACAVALRGLRMLGAHNDRTAFLVPDRRVHGYGLTPSIVELALHRAPKLLVTVDNGIASFEGVAHARRNGLDVLITDHHLPALVNGAAALPDANIIVNPNQPGCLFESKSLAGVGVMFYVLLATRAALREAGRFDASTQPRLDALLDLVALGTVADVVKLDTNNRRLVAQGLKRMRARRMQPGLAALFQVAGRDPEQATSRDLGFALGPRLNAAGRLADMSLGIACLLEDDPERAAHFAAQLDAINRDRRRIEDGMNDHASRWLAQWHLTRDVPAAVTLHDASFHEGVVGIVAGRVKDAVHRPTFVFATSAEGTLKGSGRSVPGVHLRDALDAVSKQAPGVLLRFGGHAMAAGCTLVDGQAATLARFDAALVDAVKAVADNALLERRLWTDGPLQGADVDTATVVALDAQVWGQAFDAPVFCDVVDVLHQRVVADKHLKLRLRHAGVERDAIWFGRVEAVEARVRMAYRLALDQYQGRERVQLMVEAVEAVEAVDSGP
jgi:single-stranded-DNA-specific exonuclease